MARHGHGVTQRDGDRDQREGVGRRTDDNEPGIKTFHIWLAVLVMCGTVVATGWRTAVSVGEKAGEGNATLRQIGTDVGELKTTMKTVVEEQQAIKMKVQKLDDTTVKYDNAPQRRSSRVPVLSVDGSTIQ